VNINHRYFAVSLSDMETLTHTNTLYTYHVMVQTPMQAPDTAPRDSYETASGSLHGTKGIEQISNHALRVCGSY